MFTYAQGPFPLFACLAWLLLPGWVLFVLGRMIMNEMDSAVGTIAIGLAVFLGIVAFRPPTPLAGQLAVWSIWLTALGWVPVARLLERRDDRAHMADAIESIYDALTMNPNNTVAAFRLARAMAQMGYVHHADGLARTLMGAMPRATFREEHRLAAEWAARAAAYTASPLTCPQCGAVIFPGTVRCPACGSAWLSFVARRGAGGVGSLGRTLAVWGALVVVLLGMASLSAFSAPVAIGGAITLLIAAGLVAWWAFRPMAA